MEEQEARREQAELERKYAGILAAKRAEMGSWEAQAIKFLNWN